MAGVLGKEACQQITLCDAPCIGRFPEHDIESVRKYASRDLAQRFVNCLLGINIAGADATHAYIPDATCLGRY